MFFTGYLDLIPVIVKAIQQNKESSVYISKLCSRAPDTFTYALLKEIEKDKKNHCSKLEKMYIEAVVSAPPMAQTKELEEDSFIDILKSLIIIQTELIDTYKNICSGMKNNHKDSIFEMLIEEINCSLKLNWIYSGIKK